MPSYFRHLSVAIISASCGRSVLMSIAIVASYMFVSYAGGGLFGILLKCSTHLRPFWLSVVKRFPFLSSLIGILDGGLLLPQTCFSCFVGLFWYAVFVSPSSLRTVRCHISVHHDHISLLEPFFQSTSFIIYESFSFWYSSFCWWYPSITSYPIFLFNSLSVTYYSLDAVYTSKSKNFDHFICLHDFDVGLLMMSVTKNVRIANILISFPT